jgi:hypothetical protein
MNGRVTRTAALGSVTGCELSRILAARDSSADHETHEPLTAMVYTMYTRSCTLMEPTGLLRRWMTASEPVGKWSRCLLIGRGRWSA